MGMLLCASCGISFFFLNFYFGGSWLSSCDVVWSDEGKRGSGLVLIHIDGKWMRTWLMGSMEVLDGAALFFGFNMMKMTWRNKQHLAKQESIGLTFSYQRPHGCT